MLEQTFLRKNSEKKNKMAELTTGITMPIKAQCF